VSDLPIFLAVERGYFSSQGLDVELIPFQAVAAMTAPLASGELLVGAGGVTSGLFNAMVRDIPIRVVADRNYVPVDFTGTGWAVRKDLLDSGQVKTPADLKGLTVAMGAKGGTAETELDALLRRGGLSVSDVEVKEFPNNLQPAAFANKSIDVAFTFDPYLTAILEQDTARMWFTSGQVIPNHEQSVIIYSPVFGDRYPEAARSWMVAYVQGVRDYVKAFDNPELPEDVVAAMIKYGNEKDPAKIRAYKITPINPDGYPFKESLRAELDYFVRAGLVTSPPDLDQVVDTRFVDYAIGRLGKLR
jgi:ABC-type nitrate/sulfonate/bicarbonate transport system substrate-binding protein